MSSNPRLFDENLLVQDAMHRLAPRRRRWPYVVTGLMLLMMTAVWYSVPPHSEVDDTRLDLATIIPSPTSRTSVSIALPPSVPSVDLAAINPKYEIVPPSVPETPRVSEPLREPAPSKSPEPVAEVKSEPEVLPKPQEPVIASTEPATSPISQISLPTNGGVVMLPSDGVLTQPVVKPMAKPKQVAKPKPKPPMARMQQERAHDSPPIDATELPSLDDTPPPLPKTQAQVEAANSKSNPVCRVYSAEKSVLGIKRAATGIACRDSDGVWQITTETLN